MYDDSIHVDVVYRYVIPLTQSMFLKGNFHGLVMNLDSHLQRTFWRNAGHTARIRMVSPWYGCADVVSSALVVERYCYRLNIGHRGHQAVLPDLRHWEVHLSSKGQS